MSDSAGSLNDRQSPTLAKFYEKYGTWLKGQVRRRFGADRSEDILQETWLSMAKLQSMDAIRHPKSFLLKVAVNSATTETRKQVALERAESASPYPGDLVGAEQHETLLLRETILGLPQPLRDVFVLSRLGGLTNDQIAEHLGIRPKTVEWRMTKALAHCAAQLRR